MQYTHMTDTWAADAGAAISERIIVGVSLNTYERFSSILGSYILIHECTGEFQFFLQARIEPETPSSFSFLLSSPETCSLGRPPGSGADL